MQQKKEHPKEKIELHPRNLHRERYDFKALIASCSELAPFVRLNEYNDESIDFSNPDAVKTLNKALLFHFYGLKYWDIPQHYLCPPIPGRADYVHYIADLLGICNKGIIPTGNYIKCLDIGVGANCVYPIIGNSAYTWAFVGTDIDLAAIVSANNIIELNPKLKGNIELRLQPNNTDIFKGIIKKDERFDITICNPPFHSSKTEAQMGTIRKLTNLKGGKPKVVNLNFGGQNNELWCEGGEATFVKNLIEQSHTHRNSCLWFSTLLSKQTNLKSAYYELNKLAASEVKTIPMGQGNKISRVVAWTFMDKEQKMKWVNERWKIQS
jgi:23S rRNA (adenine1618-N6)-methyltransferase